MGVKSMKNKPYRTRYAGSHRRGGKRGGVTVTLPFDPRKGVCEGCGKSVAKGEIKSTAMHHWWYQYHPKTVKANPILALKNTSEFGFCCHPLADSIRALLYAKPERVANVAKCLKGEQKERFINVLKSIVVALGTSKTSALAKEVLEMVKNGKK